MSVAYLDTHVAVWLHDGLIAKLTRAAINSIEDSPLLISPMVYLEFAYLYRRGRIRIPAPTLFANLSTTFGVRLCEQPFSAIAAAAADLDWTSDPFDRIIVAQSLCNPKSRLVTADESIRGRYERAVW